MQATIFQWRLRAPRLLLAAVLLALAAVPALAAGTLDKVKESGKLSIGFLKDLPPFAYADSAGKPAGFAVALCSRLGDAVKTELKLPALNVDFVPLTREEQFAALEQNKVDLLCGTYPTLARRNTVEFSIPVYVSGTGVALRSDAPVRLTEVLEGTTPQGRPIWRGSTDQAPQRTVLAVVGDTPLEAALADQLRQRRIVAQVVPVKDTAEGLQLLAKHDADAFFADRALLLDATRNMKVPADVIVLDRLFRRDLVALAMRRNDDDFRLLVDRTLSRLYRSPDISTIYSNYFGAPTPSMLDFFKLVALPE